MNLSNLPPEVMALLTSLLQSADLVACLRIGNVRLTQLLVTPGSVTSLKLNQPKTADQFFLSSFRGLKRLSMSDRGNLETMWKTLPPTLTRLELDIKPSTPFSSYSCSVRKVMPLLCSLLAPIALDTKLTDWVRTFPKTLQTLKVTSLCGGCPLPASLTYLKLSKPSELHVITPALPHLRKVKLVHLDCSVENLPPFFASLPQTLAVLEIGGISSAIGVEVVDLMPSRLVSLALSAADDVLLFSSSSDALLKFPTRLTSLSLMGSIELKLLTPFPEQLTRLSIMGKAIAREGGEAGSYVDTVVKLLPPDLIHFDMNVPEGLTQGTMALPKKIQTLEIRSSDLHAWAFQRLPSTLTTLGLESLYYPLEQLTPPMTLNLPSLTRFGCYSADRSAHYLPMLRDLALGAPNLAYLVIERVPEPNPFMEWRCGNFPPEKSVIAIRNFVTNFSTLKSAQKSPKTESNYSLVPSRFIEAQEKEQQNLPDVSPSSTPTCHSHTPPFRFQGRLTTFFAPRNLYGDSLTTTLPHSLTALSLSNSPFLTNTSIMTTVQYCSALRTFLCFSTSITGGIFQYLPRKLEFLALPAASLIVDQELPKLPQTLTSLQLQSAQYLSDDIGPLLPPNLRYLGLQQIERDAAKIAAFLPKHGECWVHTKGTDLFILNGHIQSTYRPYKP